MEKEGGLRHHEIEEFICCEEIPSDTESVDGLEDEDKDPAEAELLGPGEMAFNLFDDLPEDPNYENRSPSSDSDHDYSDLGTTSKNVTLPDPIVISIPPFPQLPSDSLEEVPPCLFSDKQSLNSSNFNIADQRLTPNPPTDSPQLLDDTNPSPSTTPCNTSSISGSSKRKRKTLTQKHQPDSQPFTSVPHTASLPYVLQPNNQSQNASQGKRIAPVYDNKVIPVCIVMHMCIFFILSMHSDAYMNHLFFI